MAINSQKFLPGAKSGSIVATTYNRSARSLMVAPPPSATSGAAIPQAQPDGGGPPESRKKAIHKKLRLRLRRFLVRLLRFNVKRLNLIENEQRRRREIRRKKKMRRMDSSTF